MITELTAADLAALAASAPRDLDVSTIQLRKGDRFDQVYVLPETNGKRTATRTVEVTGRTGGRVWYDGRLRDVWFVHGMETSGATVGRSVKFTATDHMRWSVTRGK